MRKVCYGENPVAKTQWSWKTKRRPGYWTQNLILSSNAQHSYIFLLRLQERLSPLIHLLSLHTAWEYFVSVFDPNMGAYQCILRSISISGRHRYKHSWTAVRFFENLYSCNSHHWYLFVEYKSLRPTIHGILVTSILIYFARNS